MDKKLHLTITWVIFSFIVAILIAFIGRNYTLFLLVFFITGVIPSVFYIIYSQTKPEAKA